MVANLSPRKTLTHAPVLTEEVVRYLAVRPGGRYVDCTVGAGGHAATILEAASPGGLLLGMDADPRALEVATPALARFGEDVRAERTGELLSQFYSKLEQMPFKLQ